MRVPNRLKRYYHALQEINYAVFGFVATVAYSAIYLLVIPIIRLFAPARKKLTHTSWEKWPYKTDTLEEARRQY